MANYAYYRIFGYLFTITLQLGNLVYVLIRNKNIYKEDPYLMQFKELQPRYFTCWTFGLQIFYSFVGLTCDILTLRNANKKNYKLPKHLKGLRDTLFAGIQFPANLLVFSIFWTLFNYDRSLILPEIIDRVLPRISNHIIHTMIVPIVLWEVAFQPRMVPKSHRRNLMHMAFYSVIYFAVLFYTYYERGVWIYPIFGIVYGTIYLPILIAFFAVLLYLYYHLQWYLTRLFWGNLTVEKLKKIS